MFLELPHMFEVELGPVAEEHAEHGDGEQAALRLQQVRHGQGADRCGEEDDAVEEVGDGVAAHGEPEYGAQGDRHSEPGQDRPDQAEQDRRRGLPDTSGEHALEHEGGVTTGTII